MGRGGIWIYVLFYDTESLFLEKFSKTEPDSRDEGGRGTGLANV